VVDAKTKKNCIINSQLERASSDARSVKQNYLLGLRGRENVIHVTKGNSGEESGDDIRGRKEWS